MTVDQDGKSISVTWTSLAAAMAMALTILGGAVGILNWLYAENNRLREEITAVRVEIAKSQVSKTEFKEALRDFAVQIDGRLARIEKQLTAKQ